MLSTIAITLLAFQVSTAVAAPANGASPALCSQNFTAMYDTLSTDVLTGTGKLPKNVDGLSYFGLSVGNYEHLNLLSNPESPPNTIFFTKQTPRPHRVYRAKGTKSFDLNSLYFMCSGVNNIGVDVPLPCTVRAFGTKVNGGVVAVNMEFGSGILPLVGADMQQFSFPKRFSNLKHVEFTLVGALIAQIKGVNFDNLEYTTHAKC